jgi:hypothetical protein
MCKEALSLTSFELNALEAIKPTSSIEHADTLEAIVSRMSALQAQNTQVALVTITLRFEQDGKTHTGRVALADQSTLHYLENLRSLVRKTDSVFLLRHTFYFLLLGADLSGAAIVQERLWEALLWRVHNTLEGDFLRPRTMMIGHGACTARCNDFTQCIDAASEAQLSFDVQPFQAARKVATTKDGDLPVLARRLGVPYVPLLPRKLPARLQRLVSPTLAQELHCFPIGRDRDILTVAMSNPQDRNALERLRAETGLNIFPVLANQRELQTALEQFV